MRANAKPSIAIVALACLSLLLLGAKPFPEVIDLPEGIAGEGIATGTGTTFYAGSLANGQVVKGDLRTGVVDVLVDEPAMVPSVGLSVDVDNGMLFAAGGPTGQAAAYDTTTGETIAALTLTTGPAFINDVVVTGDAAWFTNSVAAELYRVPIGSNGDLGLAETVALSGPAADLPGEFNLNGIDATSNGKHLVVVNSTTGALFTIDPDTGGSATIDLGDDDVITGDGILLAGRTLYVLQNGTAPGVPNQVAVVDLSGDLSSGEVVDTITNAAFETATTLASHGSRLAAVNAQFAGAPIDPGFEVVVFDAR